MVEDAGTLHERCSKFMRTVAEAIRKQEIAELVL